MHRKETAEVWLNRFSLNVEAAIHVAGGVAPWPSTKRPI
jgi:hypothetical protein